jgi:hypothetical protein
MTEVEFWKFGSLSKVLFYKIYLSIMIATP